MIRQKHRQKIEKRKLLAIPLVICLAVTMCFGINFSKVFASGYVTDDLTVKIGYWGMDESTFVEKGTYNWYTLASSLPIHKVAYYFYRENKYGYETIIDSAKGFYISDFLDFAGIERSGINSISFYTKDVNVGYFTSFSYNELFSTTRYYFQDLSGNLRPTFEEGPEEPDDPTEPTDPSGGGDDPPTGGDDPTDPTQPSGGGDNPPSGGDETTDPTTTTAPSENNDDTGLVERIWNGLIWDGVYAAEKKYKLISVSDTNAWKHKTAVQPMLALEDHWEQYETTSYNQPTNTQPNYSSLGTGNRFRLLFGQSSPKESKTNQTAKYVHTLFVTYTGVPEVVEDMKDVSGEVGQHTISFNVAAGDPGMIQSLIEQMGWSSTNEDVLVIDKVSQTKNKKYADVVTVEITYTIKKKGEASIKGTYAGIEIGGNAISTGTSSGDGSEQEGESKSGDQAKGTATAKAGDEAKKGDAKKGDKKVEKKENIAENSTTVYELDKDVARMLTQTSSDVAQTDKETLKVKREENNTGPATAAGAIGLCLGGIVAERIRFRKKI